MRAFRKTPKRKPAPQVPGLVFENADKVIMPYMNKFFKRLLELIYFLLLMVAKLKVTPTNHPIFQ